MKISSLKFKDKRDEWELVNVDFFDLTLLVGVSGVGKTQILKSILNIKNIANGQSLNSVEWEIDFSNDGKNYNWKGAFETIEDNKELFIGYPINVYEDENSVKPKLLFESISLDNKLIARKEKNEIFFQGEKMPKLASEKSVISLFKEEEDLQPAYEGFKKIVFRDHTKEEDRDVPFILLGPVDLQKINEEYKTLEDIRNSNLSTVHKLYWLSENKKEFLGEIIESYKDIFPQIEDVTIQPVSDIGSSHFFSDRPIIQFKERGVDKWILQNRMSSGMFRTFLHISEMYLLSEGTVILIDEFENSLGVNCIDILTEDLIFENNRLQFIATSHHPYIINKIPYEYWKIVTRSGGKIKTFNAKDFDLGQSNHDRFMSLINLPAYNNGIEI